MSDRLSDVLVAHYAQQDPAFGGPEGELAREVQDSRRRLAAIRAWMQREEFKVTRWDEPYEGWQAMLHGAFCPCGKCGVLVPFRCHEGCCDPANLTAEEADAIVALLEAEEAL
jgi:hypothetical protein